MKKGWWVRFSLLMFLTILSIFVLMPSVFNFNENGRFPIKSKINLGLDLQGGLYMTLGIDFNKVYREEIATTVRKMQYILKDMGITAELGKVNLLCVGKGGQSKKAQKRWNFSDKPFHFYLFINVSRDVGLQLLSG